MNITRNNYEEYFLLYADGELSHADRQEVDRFVQLHPDLADELDMLKETVLDKNAFVEMPGKDKLLRSIEWNEESLTPMQQNLLLYVDNELPLAQAAELEQQLKSDPSLRKDWKILEQTRLTAETIVMPGKEDLYRRNSRRPVPIMFVRWMAAAAVVAGLGWFLFATLGKQATLQPPTEIAVVKEKEAAENSSSIVLPNNNTMAANENKTATDRNPVTTITPAKNEPSIAVTGQKTNNKIKVVQQQTQQPDRNTASQNQNIQAEKNQEKALQSTTFEQRNIVKPENKPSLQQPTPVNDTNEKTIQLDNQVAQNSNHANPLAQPAAYNEDTADETEYVNIGGANIKKQKIRGVFRNVTRTLGRSFDKSNVSQADVASLR